MLIIQGLFNVQIVLLTDNMSIERADNNIILSKVKNVGKNNLISFSCQMLHHILSYLLADEIEK